MADNVKFYTGTLLTEVTSDATFDSNKTYYKKNTKNTLFYVSSDTEFKNNTKYYTLKLPAEAVRKNGNIYFAIDTDTKMGMILYYANENFYVMSNHYEDEDIFGKAIGDYLTTGKIKTTSGSNVGDNEKTQEIYLYKEKSSESDTDAVKISIPLATANVPGLVSIGAQTFGGDKTFNGNITIDGSTGLTIATGGLSVENNMTINSGNLTISKGTFTYTKIGSISSSSDSSSYKFWISDTTGTPKLSDNVLYEKITDNNIGYVLKAPKFVATNNDNNVINFYGLAEKAAKTIGKLTLKIGNEAAVEFNGSNNETFEVTAAKLGLDTALHFIGTTTTVLTDNDTTTSLAGISKTSFSAGDIVISKAASGSTQENEFIWTGSKWEMLGSEYADSTKMPLAGGTFTGDITIAQGKGAILNSNSFIRFTEEASAANTYHSQYRTASIYTPGGVSVGQTLAAKKLRVDSGTTSKTSNAVTDGCEMIYNSTQKCLEFTFV